MKSHDDLIQGSPQWLAYRTKHFNASDAPAMMGCSPYKTRSQLLHEMATGQVPEVDTATQRRFDEGHRIEDLARPLAAKIIGEDLYPQVGSMTEYSASFDGLTMAEDIGFEHKTLNADLRDVMHADVKGFELPLQYQVQMEQQCMVSGAERILFMASKWDGDNLVEERHCWYVANADLRAKIGAGWIQFKQDLAAYVPPEVIVPAVAAPQMGLPAVSIAVSGQIALVDNLDKFGVALTAYIAKLNRTPESDQDFANLEDAVKRLKAAEEQLDAAEASALGQTESIDTMRRTVALHRETAKTTRLLIDKLVKAEKENRRIAIVGDAVAELVTHIKKLNERLGKPYMPSIAGDFQGVIKGLKSLDSMKDKVSGELARCKIAANEAADRIQANLATLRELASEHAFLFADAAQLVGKANDDLTALVKSRIADHKAAEAAKEEVQRARIRVEEQEKAEREARANLATEQADAAARASVVLSDKAEADHNANTFIDRIEQQAAPAITHEVVAKIMMPPAVRQAMAPKADTPPTLTLGEISTRLGFNCTSAFLATLGYEAVPVKAARLYHEEDFVPICEAIKTHISEVQDQFEPVAA
jgi:putative phage-type endonuclease